jgi:hypothetical protein
MTRSDSSYQPRPDGPQRPENGDWTDAAADLPDDLRALDRSLDGLLSPRGRGEADEAMVARILALTTPDLPARVLTLAPADAAPSHRLRRVAAGLGALAAVVTVAIFAGRLLSGSSDGMPGSDGRTPRLADAATVSPPSTGTADSIDPIEAFELLQTRESEVMLVAVLDPADDWFEDEAFADLDAESVLRSRAFGLDDLEGSVFAMLGGPTS